MTTPVATTISGASLSDENLAPCFHQKDGDIERYYRNVPVGGLAAVRLTQFHMLQYIILPIVDRNASKIYVENGTGFGGNAFYAKSGKNYWEPTGQTRLVVPTEDVLAFAETYPDGDPLVRHPMAPKHIRPGLFSFREIEKSRKGITAAVDRALERAREVAKS